MSRYQEMARQVFAIYHVFTPQIEPLSIDEAFLDVTASCRLFGPPDMMARKIKEAVRKETGLTVSAGVAPSKFVAKIASDMDKPDGLTVVPPERVQAFLDPLSIGKMWGVGKKTQERFHRLGVRTFGDLKRLSTRVLTRWFGTHGVGMQQLAWGRDKRAVVSVHEAKSIGREETFSRDFSGARRARREILALSNRVARCMRREGVTGRTVTLKVKYSDFHQVTRSITLAESTSAGPAIYAAAAGLVEKTELGIRPVRLLGVCVTHLIRSGSGEQLSLFPNSDSSIKRARLDTALDRLADRFGEDAIQPATLLGE
jgi:DNA polymerase-4